jgi:hypothetical protein
MASIGMKNPIGNAHRACACLFFVTALACLCGCGTVGGPRGKESAAIQQNRPTIVWSRIICTNDVPVQQSQAYNFNLDAWRLSQPDGRMEPSPHRVRLSQRFLSKSLREQGWFYVLMDPGSYCLKITPTSGHPTNSTAHAHQPVYYLSLPADKQFVYAGTVIFHPTVTSLHVNHLRDPFAPDKATEYWLAGTSNEIEIAKNVIGTGPAGVGEMSPQLLVSYDSPVINSDQFVGVENTRANPAAPTAIVKGENWQASRKFGGVFFGGMQGTQMNVSGDGAQYVLAAIAAVYIVGTTVTLTVDGITAGAHLKQRVRCEAMLRKQVEAFHLEEKFQQALAGRLSSHETNSAATRALQLEVQPYRIVLRGNARQEFSLEVATRVRLLSQTGSQPIWEHDYDHFDSDLDRTVSDYQTFIRGWDNQHPLKDFQGDYGAHLLADQLQSAVKDISDKIVDQLESAHSSDSVATTAETPPQLPH